MLFISCRKTHQSQGQVTFLKTVPLFLQGYTYYLKKVMTPRLVPASNFVSFTASWLLSYYLMNFTVSEVWYRPRTEWEGWPRDMSTVPDRVSKTTAKSCECTYMSKQDPPRSYCHFYLKN